MSKTLNLQPPKGPIADKYLAFRDSWEFTAQLFTGPYATAKSTAMVDSILKSAVEYPGCNLLLARATLTDLKRSTIPKLESRIRLVLESENKNEAIYRFPWQEHPLTGDPVQSTVRCLGLDRGEDLEEVMSSTEWFRVFLEEAEEIPSDAHDIVLMRARQVCYHSSLKVRHLAHDLGGKWGVTPDEAYEIMASDKQHPVFQAELGLDDPMPGANGVKCVMNPANNHVWQFYVGLPYPGEGIKKEWVEENVGVRELYSGAEERDEIEYDMTCGDLVVDREGVRGYVKSRDLKNKRVTLIDGREYDDADLDLVLQVDTIYAFPSENESKNYSNVKNALYTRNRNLRKKAFMGADDFRGGLVFPDFIARPASEGGHIMPYPKEHGLPPGMRGVAGIDQGGGHATAAAFGLLTPETGTCLIFGEYVKSGVSAKSTAYELLGIPPADMDLRWGGDPAMWAKLYAEDETTSHALKYQEAGIPLEKGKKGDEAFDDVLDLLQFTTSYIHRSRHAKLYVFDNCEQTIHTMQHVTWKDIRHGRHKWIVDLADAIKIMVSMIEGFGPARSDVDHLPQGGTVVAGAFRR